MLPSSANSPGASFHQTHGFLPPSVHFGPPSAMLKTSGNVLTLLMTGPPLSLSATNTTSSSCLPNSVSLSPATPLHHLHTHPLLLSLPLISQSSFLHKILSNCPNKQSDSDPIPIWFLKECSSVLVPTITNIANLSLISGQFHPTLKILISLLLKNRHWIKNSPTVGQSRICLLFPK